MNREKLGSLLVVLGLVQCFVFMSVLYGLETDQFETHMETANSKDPIATYYIIIGWYITIPIFIVCLILVTLQNLWPSKKPNSIFN